MRNFAFLVLLFLFVLACGTTDEKAHGAALEISSKAVWDMPFRSSTLAQETPELLQGIVVATVLNVRTGPGVNYTPVGQLYQDDVVAILGRNEESSWLNVVHADLRGWVSARYISVSGDVTSLPIVVPEAIVVTPVTIARPTGLSEVPVVEVVDGDTIKVEIGGQVYRVRYIGMDTPELAEWMGTEAKVKNAELVVGKMVGLEKDISETDRYGRLLRYVWAGEIMVNAELVRLGYAQVSTFPPDVKYQDWFLQLEREARNAGRGLWGAQPAAQPAANCSPCYPDVCIPPPPPDLDCGDIPHRRFVVVDCDPHRFDGDHDGIGCER